jgi:hypothetical protein
VNAMRPRTAQYADVGHVAGGSRLVEIVAPKGLLLDVAGNQLMPQLLSIPQQLSWVRNRGIESSGSYSLNVCNHDRTK